MKKVKLTVFGLVPTLMMFLTSCSIPTVRAVGKEQHTGIIYILDLTKDSMVFKGEDGTVYESPVTQDSRNILVHSSGIWGTPFYLETSSGWKILRFTPDPTRERQYETVDNRIQYQCEMNGCWSGYAKPVAKQAAKKNHKK